MKIISVTLLIAFFVFLNVQVSGHDVCQSERDEHDDALDDVNDAYVKWVIAVGLEGAYIKELADKKKPPLPLTKGEAAMLTFLTVAAIAAYDDLQDAESTANSKKIALGNCIALDTRDCDNDGYSDDCSRLHTQNVTSCECNCSSSGTYGCECGPCSSYLNNN